MTDCKCHGEPMYWTKDTRYRAGGFYHCRVKRIAQGSRRYWTEPTLPHLHRRLLNRHAAAMYRKRQREIRGTLERT